MTGVRPVKEGGWGGAGQCWRPAHWRPLLIHKAPGPSHSHPRYLDFSGHRLVGPFSCFLYPLSSLGWTGLGWALPWPSP